MRAAASSDRHEAGLPLANSRRRWRATRAGVSLAALMIGLAAAPASAQLARMRANAGTIDPTAAVAAANSGPARPASMVEAAARQRAIQNQAQQLRTYVQSARVAAYASVQGAGAVTDGISTNGLNPIPEVRVATLFAAASAAAGSAKANVAPSSTLAVNDRSGLRTWDGATAPVQTTGDNGAVHVAITQTQPNAVLSWQNFDVGAKTTLQFIQRDGGVAQPGWTVVNRVVNAANPSKILGTIQADGTVLILNGQGVIFGPKSQVNLNSLIASSLELGNFASKVEFGEQQRQFFTAATVAQRNTGFLQNGLLVSGPGGFQGQLLSALLPDTRLYDINEPLPTPALGDIVVDSGAQLTSGAGGFVILAGPTIVNAGSIYATDGQVSLQAGLNIGAVASPGGSGSIDPNVRGLVLSSQVPQIPQAPQAPTPDQGSVTNYGYIESRRGYISLGTAPFGTVTNSGLLQATTSVSRNAKVSLTGGNIVLAGGDSGATASGIVVLADDNGETVPQGTAAAPPAFNHSQVAIGDTVSTYLAQSPGPTLGLFPSVFAMERNAFIYAPSGNVVVGANAASGNFALQPQVPSGVTIAPGATISVAGLADVPSSAEVNSVKISPAKKNELRDTPTYRSVTTDGSFTLNGATLYVDATVSGVRADGVAWQGSPLLEAASAISQIPVSAAQLMTSGGTISIDLGTFSVATGLDPAAVPAITVARDALFDVSGGWVSYGSGYVRSSALVTKGGRLVNIASADPNGDYIAVANGFTAQQPAFGLSATYANGAIAGARFVDAYDEGRDAGALMVVGTEIAFGGKVLGQAYAGSHQLVGARQPSAASSLGGDPRKLQFGSAQLPAGGLFRIGSFAGNSGIGLGQDIVVAPLGQTPAAPDPAILRLDSGMLSDAGLSGLMLQTSGAVALARGGDLSLAPGGTLQIDAGRTIRLDANVRIPGGTVAARTYQLVSVQSPGIGTVGNPFRTDDDIAPLYASAEALPRPFDLTVTGVLDVSGRWTNDYLAGDSPQGAGWVNGGSIGLTVAPRAFIPLGGDSAGDLSGSLVVAPSALLDVSAGGYVTAKGALALTASGGNVSLIDATTYASFKALELPTADSLGSSVVGQGIAFSTTIATPTTQGVFPAIVPAQPRSRVSFATSSLRGFGFSGGGTFKLIAPEIAVGGAAGPLATAIGLDFLSRTGFGTLDLTAYHSRIVTGLFDNGSTGASAFFDTTRVTVGKGQTLDLNQWLLPNLLDAENTSALRALPTGARTASLLVAARPDEAWYYKPATLALNGLMELDVEAGGLVTGAAGASITTPKLYNAGTIVLPGGTITGLANLPAGLVLEGVGLVDPELGGSGFAGLFGAPDASGRYRLGALNAAGLQNGAGAVMTNNALFTTPGSERIPYFLARVGIGDALVMAAGSVTDLSGTVVYSPAAPLGPDGRQLALGTIYGGGRLATAAAVDLTTTPLFPAPRYGANVYADPTSTSSSPPPQLAQTAARSLTVLPGALVDISGTSAMLDTADSRGRYTTDRQWSDAGSLALLGGGTLSGAAVRAFGGDPQATGGTLELLRPTLDAALSSQIEAGGFSTLIADGGLRLDGKFALTMNRSILVRSPEVNDGTFIGTNAEVSLSATAGTQATLAAPYINLSSRSGVANATIGGATGDATVTLSAGKSGLDFMGGILFDTSIRQVNLDSAADIRLIGVDDRVDASRPPVLDGQLVAAGNITMDAARVYTTTGTGNLQRIIEDAAGATDPSPPVPYLLAALGDSSITVRGTHVSTDTPLSAGSYLRIQANSFTQEGYLAAPMGRISFGTTAAPINQLTFAPGSVTSVSGAGLNVPYGTTTNLAQYFFTPSTSAELTQLPSGDLTLSGRTITVDKGALVDGTGGGSLFAYEFVSGTGGSRDVLSRFNTDEFSSNAYSAATGIGYLFPDKRQVYAIVPKAAQGIAVYDPVYSADYSAVPTFDDNGTQGPTNLYGTSAALAVKLDGGGALAGGEYVLMPAHYALLPGAYRVVVDPVEAAPALGDAKILRDGSVVMGGTLAVAGTALSGSRRLSFTVQDRASFLQYSTIQATDGGTNLSAAAAATGRADPSLPLDAARVTLAPLARLAVDGTFRMVAASGGRGSQVDIVSKNIDINASGISTDPTALALSNATLANLGANSLLVGGERHEQSNGSTVVYASASSISVKPSADITVPELIFAVGSANSRLVVSNGASLTAAGTLDSRRVGDYVIDASQGTIPDGFDQTGVGSFVRLSTGVQRAVTRVVDKPANLTKISTINIGAADLSANALLLETNGRLVIDDKTALTVPDVSLAAASIGFGLGGNIGSGVEKSLAAAAQLTVTARNALTFEANTVHAFNGLTIDAPGIAFAGENPSGQSLALRAGAVKLLNSSGTAPDCTTVTCGAGGNALTLSAESVTFGSGVFKTYAFDGSVSLGATKGVYVEGAGQLAMGSAALTITAPFVIDRAAVVDPNAASTKPSDSVVPTGNYAIPVTPDYLFATTGSVALAAPVVAQGQAVAAPAGLRAPGTRIAFGTSTAPVASLVIDGAALTATAGVIDADALGGIALTRGASLATPGFARSYGNAQDLATVTAAGGVINLVSRHGDITAALGTTIRIDDGANAAGSLALLAAEGAVQLDAALNPGITGFRTASLALDSQTQGFDLKGFVDRYGALFGGTLAIRTGTGGLSLVAGQRLRNRSVSLTADGGSLDIAGTIDTSGASVAGMTGSAAAAAQVAGGDIALWGMTGVTLQASARLDTRTGGYAQSDTRSASAGNITLGIGDTPDAAITIASGARLALDATGTEAAIAAGQTGNRLVPRIVVDPDTLVRTTAYDFVAADSGGTLLLRAPVLGTALDRVNISVAPDASITGAAARRVEGYATYDLDALAAGGLVTGLTSVDGSIRLDPTPTGSNLLSDQFTLPGAGITSVAKFVRDFALTSGQPAGFAALPGVELRAAKDLTLAQTWNLAAGTLDTAAALANRDASGNRAPLLTAIPELGLRSSGEAYYAVTPATGTITFAGQPFAGASVTIAGETIEFVAANPVGNQVAIGKTIADTVAGLAGFLGSSTSPALVGQAYSAAGTTLTVTASAGESGPVGVGLAVSSQANATVSAPVLVADAESLLLAKDVSFLYRVGGKASGAAPAVTLRAGGNLDLKGSLSDGFFTFADKSDATWINYQLGGGARTYNAGVLGVCAGAGDCSTVARFAPGPVAGNAFNITLSSFVTAGQDGASLVVAPYDAAANSAVAAGSNVNPATTAASGDALGFAQLFPLLPDGTAMNSSALRLVAGGSSVPGANPLHVDRGAASKVVVEGTGQYALAAPTGSVAVNPVVKLLFDRGAVTPASDPSYAADMLAQALSGGGEVQNLTRDSLTTLNWGDGRSAGTVSIRQAALAFFAGKPSTFVKATNGNEESVAVRFEDAVAFLASSGFASGYIAAAQAGNTPGITGAITPATKVVYANPAAFTNTLVRTGNGRIDIAAAGDVDLTNAASNLALFGTETVLRDTNGAIISAKKRGGIQVGGTALYTAGTRIASGPVLATRVDDGAIVALAQTAAHQAIATQNASFIPSPKGFDDQAAVLADHGGDIAITAGGSVRGVRDAWGESTMGTGGVYNKILVSASDSTAIGDASQRWRVGKVGQNTRIAVAPKYFATGIGALGGGDISIAAGGNLSDLTVALDSAVLTDRSTAAPVLMTYGSGNLTATIGGNLLAGQVDLAHGSGSIAVAGNVAGFGTEVRTTGGSTQYLRVRVADATMRLDATGTIAMAGVSALGAANGSSSTDVYNAAGYFAANAGFTATATGSLSYLNNRTDQALPFQVGAGNGGIFGGSVLPPSLSLSALTGTLAVPATPFELYPSATGQLSLFSAGSINSLIMAMSDTTPTLLPGAFSAAQVILSSLSASGGGNVSTLQGLGFGVPGVTPVTSQTLRRLYHDQAILHGGDSAPIRVFAGIDLTNSLLNLPKQAQIVAGRDITNLYFTGQNVSSGDTTIIQAGRDITSTTGTSPIFNLPFVVSNQMLLGGPGNFVVQSGRNIGPFINSATVDNVSYAGGIQTVGNLYNPWMGSSGANLTMLFGVGRGIDYGNFAATYLDPVNFAKLDGNLFVQETDALGNKRGDRSKQVYAPVLAQWLRANDPIAFAAVFGLGAFADAASARTAIALSPYAATTAGDAALTAAAYGQSAAMYRAFTKLGPLLQNQFLVNDVYFNELRQPAVPTSPSYLQYVRGYRAIETLFPASRGYTNNLSVYTDSGTVSADHPQGVPIRKQVDGQPAKAEQVVTGNANLILATLQTASGGDLTILGPGGTFIAGSVVRTSAQAASRVTRFGVDPTQSLAFGALSSNQARRISSIPLGFEGVLTLNGGRVNSFTDGNFLVNQSRVFTQAGGDIEMWSSNGDLNAGQGPKSASNFPPVTVLTDLDGHSTVDSAGSVAGAGIGAFRRSPSDPLSSIILIAPAGLVDAGDAGVRATGDVLVAAARVANSDAFSAGGSISGVPARAATPTSAGPSSASSTAAAQASANGGNNSTNQPRSIITVDVLGYAGGQADCEDPNSADPRCKPAN